MLAVIFTFLNSRMTIESWQVQLHKQTSLSSSDLIQKFIPKELEYNEIAQGCDLSEIDDLTLDHAVASFTLYIRQNYTGPKLNQDELPKWAKGSIDFEIDGETGMFYIEGYHIRLYNLVIG